MIKRKDYILYLENDPADAIRFSTIIECLCSRKSVVVRKNGKEGLQFLKKNRTTLPRIIILDLNLPVMGGLEFLERIKQMDVFRSIPVIVFTASDSDENVEQSFVLQAAGYMVKPSDEKDFIRMATMICKYWYMSTMGPES